MKRIHCASLLAVAAFAPAGFGQTVANGSMTGPPAIATPPPMWNSLNTDGDTIPVGGLSGWATGIPASPDGGTFLAVLDNGPGGAFDECGQTIAGFTPGELYELTFSYVNAGLDSSAASNYANPLLARVLMFGTTQDTQILAHGGFGSQIWFTTSMTFLANSASTNLTFRAVSQGPGGAAAGIDGVSLRLVPTPGPVALLGLAVGSAALRRRRA